MQIQKNSRFPAVYLRAGRIYMDKDGAEPFSCEDQSSAAVCYSNQGAEALAVIELSDTNKEQEQNIACMKQLVSESEIPVFAGGKVKRFEDVKKYLYTGADKALFLPCEETEGNALSEASARFGREKLIFCGDMDTLFKCQREVVEYTGAFCLTDQEPEEALEAIDFITTDSIPVFSLISGAEAMSLMSKTELAPKLAWQELTVNGDGLIPVIVQEYRTNQVLMLAYMNEEAYHTTLATGKMTYYSRSRGELWVKGLTSGHFQYVKELTADCDRDTLLAKVSQIGSACHTGSYSCFFNNIIKKEYRVSNPLEALNREYATILDRKENPKKGSYTNYLFDKGLDKILKKVGEEAAEIIIAAKNPDPEEIKYEISDFLYHVMVLMAEKGVTWEDITKEISNR